MQRRSCRTYLTAYRQRLALGVNCEDRDMRSFKSVTITSSRVIIIGKIIEIKCHSLLCSGFRLMLLSSAQPSKSPSDQQRSPPPCPQPANVSPQLHHLPRWSHIHIMIHYLMLEGFTKSYSALGTGRGLSK